MRLKHTHTHKKGSKKSSCKTVAPGGNESHMKELGNCQILNKYSSTSHLIGLRISHGFDILSFPVRY